MEGNAPSGDTRYALETLAGFGASVNPARGIGPHGGNAPRVASVARTEPTLARAESVPHHFLSRAETLAAL